MDSTSASEADNSSSKLDERTNGTGPLNGANLIYNARESEQWISNTQTTKHHLSNLAPGPGTINYHIMKPLAEIYKNLQVVEFE